MVIPPLVCLPPATALYIPNGTANTWVGNYILNKRPHLSTLIGKPETEKIDFSIAEIVNFLNDIVGDDSIHTLRIYYANYDANSDAEGKVVMGNNVNSLTVVFAPTKLNDKGEQEDKGSYYGVNAVSEIVPISALTAKTWIKSYLEGGKWQKLKQELGKPETKCIIYEKDKLGKLLAEINCFKEHHSPQYISLIFAAYAEPTRIPNTAGGYDVENQMCILISIMDKNKEPFIIEKALAYSHYDTGTPCPPENNCLGSIELK